MSSSLLNKPVSVEFGGSLTNGQVYVAKKHIVHRQRSELCLLQLPVMKGEVGAVANSVPEERCLGTISFLMGVMEAHRQGRLRLL